MASPTPTQATNNQPVDQATAQKLNDYWIWPHSKGHQTTLDGRTYEKVEDNQWVEISDNPTLRAQITSNLQKNKWSIARWAGVAALATAVVVGILACVGYIPSLPAGSVGAFTLVGLSSAAFVSSLIYMAVKGCQSKEATQQT